MNWTSPSLHHGSLVDQIRSDGLKAAKQDDKPRTIRAADQRASGLFFKHLSFSKQPLPVPCRDTTKSTSAEAPSKTSPKKPCISHTPASPALSANIGSRARMGSTKHLRSEFWLYSRNISTCIRRPQARLHPLLGTSRGRKSASLDRSVSFSVRLPPDFPLNAVRKHAAESSPTPIVKNGQNSL